MTDEQINSEEHAAYVHHDQHYLTDDDDDDALIELSFGEYDVKAITKRMGYELD